jgi:cytochrome P450
VSSTSTVRDAFEAEQRLRPLRFSDGHDGWLTTKYSTCKSILADARFANLPPRPLGGDDGGLIEAFTCAESVGDLLRLDPPEHTRLRRTVTSYFTVRRVEEKRAAVERIVEGRLRAMEEAGPPLDFVQLFALRVPALSLCDFLGVDPSESHRFEEPTRILATFEASLDEKKAAMRDFFDFVWSVVEEKRARPGDDPISALVATDLTDNQLKGLIHLLLAAGLHTTATMFTVGVFFLLSDRDRWDAVRANLSSIDNTVEELLRFLMTANMDAPRTALEDVEVDGVLIRAGEAVAVCPGRPGGDLIADPDLRRFDPHHDASGHLAFGHGRHMCLGQHLARLELQVGFRALMERFPTLDLGAPIESIPWFSSEGLPYNPAASIVEDPLPVRWQSVAGSTSREER